MRQNFRSKIQFNKQIILRLIAIFLISQILFCASAKRYVANRGNDLKDIVNIGVEKDVYGIQFAYFIGYQNAVNGEGYGLRFGYFGAYLTGDRFNKIFILDKNETNSVVKKQEQVFPGYSSFDTTTIYHKAKILDDIRAARKEHLIVVSNSFGRCQMDEAKYRNILLTKGRGCSYYSQRYYPLPMEFFIGYNYGFRIGINFTELLDFLVGIVGFDALGDDISYSVYMKAPQPLPEKKDWESNLDALDEKMDKRLTK